MNQEKDLNKIYPSDLGFTADSSFATVESGPRIIMTVSQARQAVPLINPKPSIIQTGYQYRMHNTLLDISLENDSEIIEIIPRYDGSVMLNQISTVTEIDVIYRDMKTNKICNKSVKRYTEHHLYFNYDLEWQVILNDFKPGLIIPAGTVLGKSPQSVNGTRAPGLEANVALMTIKAVGEDSVVASRSFCKAAAFTTIEKKEVQCGDDFVLLNTYGTLKEPKYFPGIGEQIRADGLLCVTREFRKGSVLARFNRRAMMHFDNDFDKPQYVRKGKSTIIDIEVFKTGYNDEKSRPVPEWQGVFDDLDRYADGCHEFLKKKVAKYEDISTRVDPNELENLLDNGYATDVVRALNMVNATNKKYEYKKDTLPRYRIIFTIRTVHELTPGKKVTFKSGDKAVISEVWDDADMPTDENGVIADIIMHGGSTNSRMNYGRLYMSYISDASLKLKMEYQNIIKNGNINDDNLVNQLFENTIPFLQLIGSGQERTYSRVKDVNTRRALINEIINENFYLFIPASSDIDPYEITKRISKSKYGPVAGHIKFKVNGIERVTKEKMFITSMYLIVLNKIADTWLACSSPKINHFNLPVGASKSAKYSYPWSNTPVGWADETTVRQLATGLDPKLLAGLKASATSINTMKETYSNLLTMKKPSNIKKIVNRETNPYGDDGILKFAKSIFKSVGSDFGYVPDVNDVNSKQITPVEIR